MARSVEETKKQLMAAATAEFAARGPHGTTMEQIAKRAGVNKERLYTYYGDKLQVFTTVLAAQLAEVAEAVPIDDLYEAVRVYGLLDIGRDSLERHIRFIISRNHGKRGSWARCVRNC